MPGQRRLAIQCPHVIPDLVRHAERGRVGHAQLALQFLGRDAVAGRGEQVHRIEPLLQGRMRPMEHGPDHRENLEPAPRALIGRMPADAVKLPVLAALGTVQLFAVTKLHEVVQASVVVWELLHKLLNGRGFCHVSLHR